MTTLLYIYMQGSLLPLDAVPYLDIVEIGLTRAGRICGSFSLQPAGTSHGTSLTGLHTRVVVSNGGW